jgi:hypothetical protein
MPATSAPTSAPTAAPAGDRAPHDTPARRLSPEPPTRPPTDDEILGLLSSDDGHSERSAPGPASRVSADSADTPAHAGEESLFDAPAATDSPIPEDPRAAFDANPELRRAWQDAHAYRETFATPEEARAATALLADLDRMDALFFSRRPEDHAELARAVASLDADAFASLARAMSAHASSAAPASLPANFPASPREATHSLRAVIPSEGSDGPETRNLSSVGNDGEPGSRKEIPRPARDDNAPTSVASVPAPAQSEFFHATNAAAVQGVLDAIEAQVERLLPDGISKSARNRVVGEIYRELDTTLRSNRQLAQQMRDAFRSGALDAEHQRAIVSLVTGRARQALPGVAKRVLNEWTSTVVAASHDRRTRQRAAERRIDIAGSGGASRDGFRPMRPRDIDYARLSDSDILNL